MKSLLGHGETNEISPLLCALERDHAEWKTRDALYGMPLPLLCFGSRGQAREGWIWFAGEWHRQEAESLLGSDASLSSSIPHLLGHCFGAFATPGGKLALLLCLRTLRVTVSICDGPSVNAELRPWESRPLA